MVNREGKPHALSLFRKVIEVNLIGTFCVTAFAARLAKAPPAGEGRGVVINTAWVAAYDGQVGQAAIPPRAAWPPCAFRWPATWPNTASAS